MIRCTRTCAARAPEPVAGADDDRLGDGDRADLPGTEGQARRPRGARAAAQCLDHRLRLRDARPTSDVEEVNGLFKAAAEGALKGILGYEERPWSPWTTQRRSALVDRRCPHTLVIDGTQVKIYAWYDNEWGYANRYVELARKLALSL
jgi:hypothetical protein